MAADAIEAGMTAARKAGIFDADLVAVEARLASEAGRSFAEIAVPETAAADGERPVPSLAGYDRLLAETQVGA